MKNKGFTLIELLAVIVILAIIALIAVPIILSIIDNARESANKRSIEMYGDAIKYAVADYMIANKGQVPTWDDIKDNIDDYYDGARVTCDTTVINDNGTIYLDNCTVNGKKVDQGYGNEEKNDGDTFTGTIYRNSTEVVYNGAPIKNPWCVEVEGMGKACFSTQTVCEEMLSEMSIDNAVCEIGEINYEISLSNIEQDYYLKHDVVNDIIEASYACVRLTGNEYCLNGVSSYEENVEYLRSKEQEFISNGLSCTSDEWFFGCTDSFLGLQAHSLDFVFAGVVDGGCYVYSDGYSDCD